MAETTETIRNWLKALGTLVAASMAISEVSGRLDAFVPMLAESFQPRHFTRDSLRFVAEKCKFFPTYGELCDHLNAWGKQNPTPAPALPSDQNSLSDRDSVLVKTWFSLKPERVQNGRLTVGLSIIRRFPAAFREICNQDPEAHRIAQREEWIREPIHLFHAHEKESA